jgi:AbrB family looped-hinge helix DNA binding protein
LAFAIGNENAMGNTLCNTCRRGEIMPRVTQKGQVTIPRQIRSMLGIETGDEVIFEMDKDQVVLKKRTTAARNFEKYVGFLSHLEGKRPEDIIDQLRGNSND